MHDSFTSPTAEKTEIRDGSIFDAFRDIGDKLLADGDIIHGFSIRSENGIYTHTKAEIVAVGTVRVFSETVDNPVGAAYAYT